MTAAAPFAFVPPPELADHPGDPLLGILDLEEVDANLYRTTLAFTDRYALYGGQVAAQALRAAGLTVPSGRLPHSLHGYFLRPGDASRTTAFRVERDRDGRSYSARRVVALQQGEVIFSMSASFHATEDEPQEQATAAPRVPAPEQCDPFVFPRLFSLEGRRVEPPKPHEICPMRFWARGTSDLGDDPLLHACAFTYLSDISSGLFALENKHSRSGASLDHAVWFHRPVRMDDWALHDYVPHTASGGRGWYTGSVFDRSGQLVASLAQEALFRRLR